MFIVSVQISPQQHTLHQHWERMVCCLAAKVLLHRADQLLHSARPSVPCLRFTQNRNAVETLN